MNERTSPSIGEQYRNAADRVVRGDFPLHFDELPSIALGLVHGDDRKWYTREALMDRKVAVDSPYKHLGWWAYDAFAQDAADDNADRPAQYEKYFNPVGPNSIGFVELAKHVSTITHVYSGQIEKFHALPSIQEQSREVAGIALNSFATLERLAVLNPAVSGQLERNLGLWSDEKKWLLPNFEDANHKFELVSDEQGRLGVQAKRLDQQIEAVSRRYAEAMEKGGQTPERAVGCFALKAKANSDSSVLFSIWHGIVLAAAKHPELIEAQLAEIDHFKEGGRILPVTSRLQ